MRVLVDHEIDGVLSVAFVDDAAIQKLHLQHLGIDTPTDVITYCLEDPQEEGILTDPSDPFGEVVVSSETAFREATRRRIPPDQEVALYAIHGTLHLAGYDDKTPAKRRVMREKESWYLERY